VLDAASKQGAIPFRTFSITDEDGETKNNVTSPRFKWDVYHVENYLLEKYYIKSVLYELGDISNDLPIETIYDKLRMSAKNTLDGLIRHEITDYVNNTIVGNLDFGFNPTRKDVSNAISEAMERSISRIEKAANDQLTREALLEKEKA